MAWSPNTQGEAGTCIEYFDSEDQGCIVRSDVYKEPAPPTRTGGRLKGLSRVRSGHAQERRLQCTARVSMEYGEPVALSGWES